MNSSLSNVINTVIVWPQILTWLRVFSNHWNFWMKAVSYFLYFSFILFPSPTSSSDPAFSDPPLECHFLWEVCTSTQMMKPFISIDVSCSFFFSIRKFTDAQFHWKNKAGDIPGPCLMHDDMGNNYCFYAMKRGFSLLFILISECGSVY